MRKKERFLLLIFLFGILLAGGVFLYGGKPGVQQAHPALEQVGGGEAVNAEQSRAEQVVLIKIHVKGEVHHPGVYQLPADSRVIDAIEAAGGARTEGDVNQLNLAAILQDGSEVIVPSAEQEQEAVEAGESAQAGAAAGGKINLNTATLEQLDQLSGIGSMRAQAILDYRKKHGRFLSVDDLINVPGFGVKLVDRIRDEVTVQ